jgi:PAS domain S-box-containing protein
MLPLATINRLVPRKGVSDVLRNVSFVIDATVSKRNLRGPFSLTRVLIVDDHEVVRRGVRSLLEARADFDVCGEAVDGQDGVEKARQLKPDVVVMDVSMPKLNGFEATRMILSVLPDTVVLILSQHASQEIIKQAFHAGARGYVLKSSLVNQLESAVDAVTHGDRFVSEPQSPASSVDSHQPAQGEKMIGINVDAAEPELVRARFAAIVESSDDAIISKDLNGIINSWNSAAQRIFGFTPQEAIGKHITIIIPRELHDEETQILRRLRAGERIDPFETVRVAKAGRRLNISLTVSPVKDSQGRIIGASKIARDVTERKRIENQLREKEEILRAAFTQTYSFLAILSTDGTILEANRAALEGTGFQRSEVVGRKIWDVWWRNMPDELANVKAGIANAAQGLAVREECRYALRDGSVRVADRSLSPLHDEHGNVAMIVASGLDITEHLQLRSILEDRVRERTLELEVKNAEVVRQTEIVRELSARLLQIQDEERRRIARELHDSVGQTLAAVTMNLAHVHRESASLSPEAAKALEDNTDLLDQLSVEIRTISHLLHPPLLDEVGLQSALQWYIEGFSERSKIDVDLQLPDDFGRLPRNLEITLFRVVQECLTNIHRHSGSATAAIRIARSDKEVRLEVRDAGKGIPKETQASLASGKLSGVGLRGMHERLRQMGGQLDVQSNGTGTAILATLPVEVIVPRPAAATAKGAA